MDDHTYTAFHGPRLLVRADLRTTLTHVKQLLDGLDPNVPLVIFDDRTGSAVDHDLRGSLEDVLERALPAPVQARRGRPKLGVTAREVTLLPRHWEWLDTQRGGASATLRRLVDEARKQAPDRERVLAAQAAADRFMQTAAGDLPGYHEASRALYAHRRADFEQHTADWPEDVRAHAARLAEPAFGASSDELQP